VRDDTPCSLHLNTFTKAEIGGSGGGGGETRS